MFHFILVTQETVVSAFIQPCLKKSTNLRNGIAVHDAILQCCYDYGLDPKYAQ